MERLQHYWEYIQCTTPNCPAWLWRRNVGKEDWGRRCWLCSRNWRSSFEDTSGFYYWDPINKRQWTGWRSIGALQKDANTCAALQKGPDFKCMCRALQKGSRLFVGCGRWEKTCAWQWHSLGSSMFGVFAESNASEMALQLYGPSWIYMFDFGKALQKRQIHPCKRVRALKKG